MVCIIKAGVVELVEFARGGGRWRWLPGHGRATAQPLASTVATQLKCRANGANEWPPAATPGRLGAGRRGL